MAKAYNPIGWENGTKEADAYVTIGGVDYEVTPEQWDGNTPVDATNLDHMEKGIENSFDVKIIAYTNTEPSECATGDIYYNTTNKLLYTATGTNTWGTTGSEPLEGILYILFDSETATGTSYSWDGSDLISVGGGGGGSSDIIIVEPDEPTEETKLLIESNDLDFQGGTEITNNYSGSTVLGYSCNYVNNIYNGLTYTTTGLTPSYTIQSGGYCKIGNIVILDIKIGQVTTTGNVTLATGMPTPINNTVALTVINSTDGSNSFIYGAVDNQGRIRINCPTANKNYSLSGIYICQDTD